jgi:hypothetical protein
MNETAASDTITLLIDDLSASDIMQTSYYVI